MTEPLPAALLPDGIRARIVAGINGLDIHMLEAGFEQPGRPCLLLLHGFPELAFSWRKVMRPLAALGYHVIAPDLRGYGRTTGWENGYDADLGQFRLFNVIRDMLGLLHALGRDHVEAVVGHDFGSPVAAWCALVRPDVFRAVAMMSSPFGGPPRIGRAAPARDIHADLAALKRPRKHYQWYYSTRPANADMVNAPQGLHAFLRGYYHHKSADWAENRPYRLAGWTAEELAKLPTYYVMDLGEDMAATVAHEMPTADAIAANRWLPEADLAVYAAEYGRTGFQGGLQWYRSRTTGRFETELEMFSGRAIDVPSCFISGASDWGIHQFPGGLEAMNGTSCTQLRFVELIPGAGHWVQQEQPEATVAALSRFLASAKG
ncbi:MAG: alpha/beta fold hydrolase [Alphaproteobacteria bacterium]|nr:alpha/beta fold hydrolase [Alphaproteobacteria bacterium]